VGRIEGERRVRSMGGGEIRGGREGKKRERERKKANGRRNERGREGAIKGRRIGGKVASWA